MVSVQAPPEELIFPEVFPRGDFQRVLRSLGQMDMESVDCQVSGWSVAFCVDKYSASFYTGSWLLP